MQADYNKHFLEFQNEIKQIKTENEANIKIIKQKNKEKYQQLETENRNRMENLKEIIKEKEVKITSLDGDIKQLFEMNSSSNKRNEELIFEFEQLSVKKQKTDQIIQSLETKINQNEKEHLNKIKLMEENVQQKEDKINSLDIQAKKGNETINDLNKKIIKLTEEQENLIYYIVYKRPKYIQIKNKWKYIDNRKKCCEGDCVNTNTPTGKCKNGHGFIEIINDTDIKYNKCIEGGKGK
uniref:Uncharacterized protein n=1 Tax=Meloidogyne enterolobii TaxID=390850 RepID=A0A6V7UTG2_MELEN|nr:unnamed protein product [Meloidogyne enterolobii]